MNKKPRVCVCSLGGETRGAAAAINRQLRKRYRVWREDERSVEGLSEVATQAPGYDYTLALLPNQLEAMGEAPAEWDNVLGAWVCPVGSEPPPSESRPTFPAKYLNAPVRVEAEKPRHESIEQALDEFAERVGLTPSFYWRFRQYLYGFMTLSMALAILGFVFDVRSCSMEIPPTPDKIAGGVTYSRGVEWDEVGIPLLPGRASPSVGDEIHLNAGPPGTGWRVYGLVVQTNGDFDYSLFTQTETPTGEMDYSNSWIYTPDRVGAMTALVVHFPSTMNDQRYYDAIAELKTQISERYGDTLPELAPHIRLYWDATRYDPVDIEDAADRGGPAPPRRIATKSEYQICADMIKSALDSIGEPYGVSGVSFMVRDEPDALSGNDSDDTRGEAL